MCGLVMSMGDSVCWGGGGFLGIIISWKFGPLWYLFIEYYIVNEFLLAVLIPWQDHDVI
jgi:hypothetical protein